MTLDQILGIIGQLATWVTVFIVFLTLREMEKQRKESQKPEIIIPSVVIYGYTRKKSKLQVPVRWVNQKSQIGENLSRAAITLYNIGIGAAKNIELTWNFDIQNNLKNIQDYCYQNSVPILMKIEDGGLIMEFDNYSSQTSISKYENSKVEYLMPVSITSQGIKTSFPHLFMHLLSVQHYIQIHKTLGTSSDFVELADLPSVELVLTYDDISGRKYKKKFDIEYKQYSIVISSDGNVDIDDQPLTSGKFEFFEVIDKKHNATH